MLSLSTTWVKSCGSTSSNREWKDDIDDSVNLSLAEFRRNTYSTTAIIQGFDEKIFDFTHQLLKTIEGISFSMSSPFCVRVSSKDIVKGTKNFVHPLNILNTRIELCIDEENSFYNLPMGFPITCRLFFWTFSGWFCLQLILRRNSRMTYRFVGYIKIFWLQISSNDPRAQWYFIGYSWKNKWDNKTDLFGKFVCNWKNCISGLSRRQSLSIWAKIRLSLKNIDHSLSVLSDNG